MNSDDEKALELLQQNPELLVDSSGDEPHTGDGAPDEDAPDNLADVPAPKDENAQTITEIPHAHGPGVNGGDANANGGSSSDGVRHPFRLVARGVEYAVKSSDGKTRWEWFCSHLAVRAKTRNEHGQEWGRLLQVRDDDNNVHVWAMPMQLLAGDGSEYRRELLSLGLRLAPGRRARDRLHEYISTADVNGRVLCVERIGWQGAAFVLPDVTIGASSQPVVHQAASAMERGFGVSGSVEQWRQQVGKPCSGNSRLVFAVSVACAAPLLRVADCNGAGLHLRGKSSLGKSTALDVAGSFCGGGSDGYVRTWRATDNALEGVAEAHNDCLLCLDEIKEVDAMRAGEIAYMLANGAGKDRMARNISLRRKKTWRLLYLSSGEQSLEDTMAEVRRRITAGQAVRLVDVPADAAAGLGLFEDLHGASSPDAFADELRRCARQFYGTPMRAYLERLVAVDRVDLVRCIREHVEEFLSEHCPQGADGQVLRIARLFGLIAAGGEIATEFGVLPWDEEEATAAAARCFEAWLDGRGTHGAAEVEAGMRRLRAFLNANGPGLFTEVMKDQAGLMSVGAPEPRDRAGFRCAGKDGFEYWMFPERFRDVAGPTWRDVAHVMAERGYLATEGGRLEARRRAPDGQRSRFYVVNALFLGESAQ